MYTYIHKHTAEINARDIYIYAHTYIHTYIHTAEIDAARAYLASLDGVITVCMHAYVCVCVCVY